MRPAGVLCDLEGTLYQGDSALPGARELVPRLRALRIPLRFVTNTTSRSRQSLVDRLAAMQIDVAAADIVTAPIAAATLARERGHRLAVAFLAEETLVDLTGLDLWTAGRPEQPTAVIVGDLGARWNHALLQQAFDFLRHGAELIACSRDRVYRRHDQLVLDVGPFVAALEYASGVTALLAGKPGRAIYDTAVRALGVATDDRRSIVMIGDDLHGDVEGAQQAGLTAWAIATGKFSPDDVARTGIIPDRVLSGLPALLAELGG